MAIEIVDFPMKNGGSFHCYISSPEGNSYFDHGLSTHPPIGWEMCPFFGAEIYWSLEFDQAGWTQQTVLG